MSVDQKITDMTLKGTGAGTDELPINDVAGGDLDKKITLAIIKTFTSNSPTFITPALGTPASGNLLNCTNLPLGGLQPGAKTEVMAIALGDESTVLSTASSTIPVVTLHMPYGFTLTDVKVGCTVAPTGAALLTVDVHEAGTTVLSTKVTVDAGEKTSGTADTPPEIDDATLAADALIEIFVDQVDTNNIAAGVKVYLIGYQT